MRLYPLGDTGIGSGKILIMQKKERNLARDFIWLEASTTEYSLGGGEGGVQQGTLRFYKDR